MQLQMTAPLDIGLEQHDAALSIGQEDVFDLGEAEKRMSKKAPLQWLNDNDLEVLESEESEKGNVSDGEEDGDLSLNEEQDKRVGELEAELDHLYDSYKDRLRERDAKFKVKEERAKNKEREKEWNGIQVSDDEDMESNDSGGWSVAERNKFDSDDSSSDESFDNDDDEGEGSSAGQKRLRPSRKSALPAAKRQRLVKTLESPPKPSSATTRLWFSQGVFSGLDNTDDLDMDEEDQEPELDEDENMEEVCHLALSRVFPPLNKFQGSEFEVVPASQDDGSDTWDADGEDKDAAKADRIRSKLAVLKYVLIFNEISRPWPRYSRSGHPCPDVGQPTKIKN
jgi:AdoMet-dependent rRNA methyltransferase SPB1